MRAPTEILGVRYFLLGVIFTRTNTRVESSHQGTPQNKNKSFFLSFPDCQSLWAGSAYITLGVASAFGPDHYILPHITQRIQAASGLQAGPHFISYPGAVPTLSCLQHMPLFFTYYRFNRLSYIISVSINRSLGILLLAPECLSPLALPTTTLPGMAASLNLKAMPVLRMSNLVAP